MDFVLPSVEEAQDPDGNVTSPVQQGPVFKQEKLPRDTGSETNKDLLQESSDYVSDILSLGLCTNCTENHLNCNCPHDILCKKCYVKRSTCNCIKKCKECKGFIFTAKIDINNSLKCFCDKNFIHSLKTKLEQKHNL